jgi:predicted PurR-regulated permease PerM
MTLPRHGKGPRFEWLTLEAKNEKRSFESPGGPILTRGDRIKESVRYFFLVSFMLVLYLAFTVVRPFINALLASAVLTYVFYPLYKLVNRKLKRPGLSAWIISILIIIIFTVPLILLANSVAQESRVLYINAQEFLKSCEHLLEDCEDPSSFLGRLQIGLGSIFSNPAVRFHLDNTLTRFTRYIVKEAEEFVLGLPTLILNVFVVFFTTFYLLREGPDIVKRVGRIIPFHRKHQNEIVKSFSEMTSATIYGQIIVSMMQGALGGLGFWLFGIPSPVLWGIVMAVTSLLPVIGAGLVWFPASVALLVSGVVAGTTSTIWRGAGLLIYGAIIVSSIDNIVRPKLVSSRAKMHPVLILIGVLGGLSVFGFIGFVVGPLILALFVTFVRIYEREKHEITS